MARTPFPVFVKSTAPPLTPPLIVTLLASTSTVSGLLSTTGAERV